MPTWREESLACDACGRQLLLGERAHVLRRGDELLLSCPLCREALLAAGCFCAAPAPEPDVCSPPADKTLAA